MSSELAMILTAAMAVPGSGPEAKAAPERPLLPGEWEGTRTDGAGATWKVVLRDGKLTGTIEEFSFSIEFKPIDEGDGKMRVKFDDLRCVGIYKRERDRITICFRTDGKERETEFSSGGPRELFILHRVKRNK